MAFFILVISPSSLQKLEMGFLDIRASPRGILEDTLGTQSKVYIHKHAGTSVHKITGQKTALNLSRHSKYSKLTKPDFSQLSPTFSMCQPRDPTL